MAVNLSPVGGVAAQFFDNNGVPLSGGFLYTYAAGTSTPQATYTSSNGGTPQANPIVLDSSGRVPSGEIWLTDGLQYKFVLQNANAVLIGTYDNIIGINSNFVNFTNQQEIQTATASQTVFTLTTMQYQPATGSLSVFVDGVNQYGPGAQYAYTETSSTVITFVNGLHVGASVKFTTSAINASSYGTASDISYTPAGTGAVVTSVQAKLRQTVSLKDFGAIGDGVANDTTAWSNFITYCTTNSAKGFIPSGTYLIDAFTFGPESSGLVLEGETFGRNAGSGAGYFGVAQTVLKLRSASATFVTMAGVYDLQISHLSLNGNQFADSVLYYTGVENNTHTSWSFSEFCGATPTTGYIHRYAGTIGGESCSFINCVLSQGHNWTGTAKAAACVYISNSNAFLGSYTRCIFVQAAKLIRYANGSANLYDCEFYDYTQAAISVDSTCQSFMVTNAYTEQTPVVFFKQEGASNVKTYNPITFINPILQNNGAGFLLNCQQPVQIFGGFSGGNISVTAAYSASIMVNIIDGVGFNTGYGITGVNAATNAIHRGCSVNYVQITAQDLDKNILGSLYVSKAKLLNTTNTLTNAGATPDLSNYSFVTISNSSPQNITFFNGIVGQIINIRFGDARTTLVYSVNFVLAGHTNVTPTAESIITMVYLNSGQWNEISRMIA